MTREQFLVAAGALYDMMNAGGSPSPTASAPGGTGDGRAPKFDTWIRRKNGMGQWASECSLKELSYWREIAGRPPSDPKYAESNAKQAKALDYWIAYRRAAPAAIWSGERNRAHVTAKAPLDKPEQYAKDAPPGPTLPTPSFDDESDSFADDSTDEIPF